jgi:tetratricopeptide (TPR) repeat protein
MLSLRKTTACLLSLGVVSCSQQSKEKSAEQIWKDASGSIVYVTAQGVDGKVAQGSGFFVKLEGKRWILTNRHVVNGAEEVEIAPQGKNPKRASAYKISPDLDLAVIECPADLDAKPLPLAKEQVNPGAEVFVLGYPLGIANVISRGIVGAVEDKYFLFDAPISSGNSGGPVVNHAGEVIGVATMGSHGIEGTVVQNLNIGIRVAAVPRLELFTDPLLRISNVSDRIRETERFIEEGFRDGDFFTVAELLSHQWLEHEGEASTVATPEFKEKVGRWRAERAALEAKNGSIRDHVKRWVEFLRKCEARIDTLPAAFAGIGNDPLLEQFLKDERSFKLSDRINARPELLPQLGRIGADHWLARFEDLRYHLEWFLRYSKLPSIAELDLESKIPKSKSQRPTIRLNFAITGNLETDLQQYRETLLHWESRDDVFKDSSARLVRGYNPRSRSALPVSDPVKSEELHGVFLGQVSSMWVYLGIAAADRGALDEAVRMLRRDLKDRSPSRFNSIALAEYLICQGKFDEAWRTYREHLLCEPSFDAFELRQGWSGEHDIGAEENNQMSRALMDVVEGVNLSVEFKNFPEILRWVDQWNEQVTKVDGREFKLLGPMTETLFSNWFNQLDALDKLRVLYYYRITRPRDEEIQSYSRTGKVRDAETAIRRRKEFGIALHTSPEAEALWTRATLERHIDPPL